MNTIYMGIVVPSTILIPVSAAVPKWKGLKDAGIIFLYLLAGGIVNLAAVGLARHGVNNMPLLHAYTVIEFIVVTTFYRKVLTGRYIRNTLTALLFLFPVWALLNVLLFQDIHVYNSYARTPEALLIIIMAITCLLEKETIPGRWTDQPVNWMNTGLLLYFSGALFLFAFSNLITLNPALNTWIWNIHATLVLIMYLLFAIGFTKCRK